MRAVQMRRFGGPEVLQVVKVPKPVPGPHQVLVRTGAAGINFAETLMREDRYAVTPELPSILGSEVAGTVEAFGDKVVGLEAGARVAAPLFAAGAFFGGYAEYVLIDSGFVIPLPDEVSFEAAAALMVQGLTAMHLVRQASPTGKSVLINAAGGGVGSLLVQLSRRAGARIIFAAASTAEKRSFAMSLGADAAIDYGNSDWVDTIRAADTGNGPDIIYESVGGEVTQASLEALAPLGEIVIYGALNIQGFGIGVPELKGLIFKNQSLTGFALIPLLTAEQLRMDLAELFGLAARGGLKVVIGGTYSFENAAEAHHALAERRTTGKLVLVPQIVSDEQAAAPLPV